MPRRQHAVRLITLSLALASGSALIGCDADAEASRALHEAQATLAALHTGNAPPPAEFILSTNQDIRSTLAPALSAEGGLRAAAQLVEGQTHIGDAEAALKRAEALEDESATLTAEARALAARLYAWRHARAEAAGSYQPEESVSDIDTAIADAQEQRTRLTRDRDEAQRRLDQLLEAAREANESAARLRTEEARLRDEALNAQGQALADATRRAFAAQRDADEAVVRASDLEAQAAQLRPALEELERRIEGAEGLVELLRASRESLRERAARLARTAQVDREQANVAADRLEALLTELHDFRTNELEPAYADAADSYRRAQTSLRSASSDGASGLWLATALHGQASLDSLRSQSAARYAGALGALAEMQPRLPFAGELQTRASEAAAASESFATDARDAYDQASSSYSRAARGPGAERVRDLAQRLEARASGVEYQEPQDEDAPADDAG